VIPNQYQNKGGTLILAGLYVMKPVEVLDAVQHIRKLRGGSQAHLLRASDNNFYVTKFKNNPQHIRILASEYLGTKIGILLDLPMPEVKVIDVSEWLIANTPELRVETAGQSVRCATGLQLGVRYAADPEQDHIFDYLPESMFERISNQDDFPRVLAFDKWTCNSDGRQAVFVKRRGSRLYNAIFIDQGYCFNAGEWDFPDHPLRGVYARNAIYDGVTSWQSFEPVLSEIDQIGVEDLQSIAQEIPEEWYQHDSDGLAGLINALHTRRKFVRQLITAFRASSRKPFPNWISKERIDNLEPNR
jgi:hypothetical protein